VLTYKILQITGFAVGGLITALICNILLLRFAHSLGIRNKNDIVIRWSNESKPSLGGVSFFVVFGFASICFSILFDDVNILFISCIKKQRIFKSLECAIEVYKTRTKQIKTSRLNNDLLPLIQSYPPPSLKGKRIKIKYINQIPGHYPQFVFFANLPCSAKSHTKCFTRSKKKTNNIIVYVMIYIKFCQVQIAQLKSLVQLNCPNDVLQMPHVCELQ